MSGEWKLSFVLVNNKFLVFMYLGKFSSKRVHITKHYLIEFFQINFHFDLFGWHGYSTKVFLLRIQILNVYSLCIFVSGQQKLWLLKNKKTLISTYTEDTYTTYFQLSAYILLLECFFAIDLTSEIIVCLIIWDWLFVLVVMSN